MTHFSLLPNLLLAMFKVLNQDIHSSMSSLMALLVDFNLQPETEDPYSIVNAVKVWDLEISSVDKNSHCDIFDGLLWFLKTIISQMCIIYSCIFHSSLYISSLDLWKQRWKYNMNMILQFEEDITHRPSVLYMKLMVHFKGNFPCV